MRKLFLLFVLSCICETTFAQATDLVVDCQTPGWLSSKINYGDQQTVKNLKVTGYINSDDLKFIGTLISSKSLNEELDLSECKIVGSSSDKDNILVGLEANGSLKKYRIPKSVKQVSKCLAGIDVDSLWFDCDIKYLKQEMLGNMPSTLIAGNSIDSIPNNAFHQFANDRKKVDGLESVVLTGNVYYIGDRAFPYIQSINFSDFRNLRYLGRNAFSYSEPSKGDHLGYYMPDTIVVPKSLENTYYLFSFCVRDGQHIFIDDNINTVSGISWKGSGGADAASYTKASLNIHFNNSTPPSLINYSGLSSSGNGFDNSTIYVPKGAKQAYLESSWKKATIIELNPVESVTLNEHSITLNKTEQFSLLATILPEDADDMTISWTSEDESIATVNESGVVTAIKEGETKIYTTSVATGIQDFCTVLVRKNVTSVTLNEDQIILNNISDTKQLVATILPEDATDKSVTWSSANEQVCTISATGLVTATGIGSTLVKVTTEDGGFIATCTVIVENSTGIVEVRDSKNEPYPTYDTMGRKVQELKKGQLYIRHGKKFVVQ